MENEDEQEIDFTLRDYYAGLAMREFLKDNTVQYAAKLSFKVADAMLAERNKE